MIAPASSGGGNHWPRVYELLADKGPRPVHHKGSASYGQVGILCQ